MIETLRCNLANVVLQLLALNVRDVLTFDFMDPPSKEVDTKFQYEFYIVDTIFVIHTQIYFRMIFLYKCSKRFFCLW